jgi:DNA-binding Lrp family transcriptional regulator
VTAILRDGVLRDAVAVAAASRISPPQYGTAVPPKLDNSDLDLIAALQCAPRATHSALADALGLSEKTVSRRLRRLTDDGILRVITESDLTRFSDSAPVHVEIECAAGTTTSVLAELVRRSDVRFAGITTGQSEIICELFPATRSARTQVLTEDIPAIHGVLRTRSHIVLRTYRTASEWRLRRLDKRVVEQLSALTPRPTYHSQRVSDNEVAVAAALADDARVSTNALAQATGLPESTVYRIANRLFTRGLVSARVDVEPELLGYHLEILLWLAVRPGSTEELAHALVEHPNMRYVTRITGSWQLLGQAVFVDEDELHSFVVDVLERRTDVDRFAITVILKVAKRYWLTREDQ